MNYFELYGMPVLMKVDTNAIHKKFYELTRLYHPDYYLKSSEHEKKEALLKSSEVEKAFKIFQNQDEVILYVLRLKNLVRDDEAYELGPDFLVELKDINETLGQLEIEPDPEKLDDCEQKTKELLTKLYSDVAPVVENYKEDNTTEKELLQVKDYYYKKKYLQRILDKIYQIRNIASHI
jgi:molecular chaperone HscB